MQKAILVIASLIGTTLILIGISAAYYWYLPLGVAIDLVAGYFYIKEKRNLREIAGNKIA